MSWSLMRGRTLDPVAVVAARTWRLERIRYLLGFHRTALTKREIHQARQLTNRLDFWNYKLPIQEQIKKLPLRIFQK
jgi:hypothetical protein